MTASPSTYSVFVPEPSFVSSRTDSPVLPVPTSGQACDDMLAFTRDRLRGPEGDRIARDLARFLGANSSVWTWPRRENLRSLLASVGERGAVAALQALERTPRTDVSDEVGVVLRKILRDSPSVATSLVRAYNRSRSVVVRATLVRALGSARQLPALSLVLRALDDAEPEVREAASFAVAEQDERAAKEHLRRRLQAEQNAVVREAIEEVLSELEAG